MIRMSDTVSNMLCVSDGKGSKQLFSDCFSPGNKIKEGKGGGGGLN